MKLLVELRPALGGHAGIPQETRLLFRGLQRLPGMTVDGLLQSSNQLLSGGIPSDGREAHRERIIDRLSRVVVSMEPDPALPRFRRLGRTAKLGWLTAVQILCILFGRKVALGRFDAKQFQDFVWRALFDRTLPHTDFDAVTTAQYRIARVPWSAMHRGALFTQLSGKALYATLDTRGYDILLTETPYPGRVAKGTHLVVRYHDAIPLLMPHTISDRAYHRAAHYHALKRNVDDGAWFACVSEATRKDLISIFPSVEKRAITIHNMVSEQYYPEQARPDRAAEIVRIRLSQSIAPDSCGSGPSSGGSFLYLLMVSTIEPRKNHLTLLAAWELLRTELFPDLKLIVVGSLGWDHEGIVRRLRPWVKRGELYVLEDVPASELRVLYRNAQATICPSYGEGFDFSGVESMRCGGVVAASDIAVHREVFGEAAEFFNPYCAQSVASAIERIISPEASTVRAALLDRGAIISSRYLPEYLLPRWEDFLAKLRANATASDHYSDNLPIVRAASPARPRSDPAQDGALHHSLNRRANLAQPPRSH